MKLCSAVMVCMWSVLANGLYPGKLELSGKFSAPELSSVKYRKLTCWRSVRCESQRPIHWFPLVGRLTCPTYCPLGRLASGTFSCSTLAATRSNCEVGIVLLGNGWPVVGLLGRLRAAEKSPRRSASVGGLDALLTW